VFIIFFVIHSISFLYILRFLHVKCHQTRQGKQCKYIISLSFFLRTVTGDMTGLLCLQQMVQFHSFTLCVIIWWAIGNLGGGTYLKGVEFGILYLVSSPFLSFCLQITLKWTAFSTYSCHHDILPCLGPKAMEPADHGLKLLKPQPKKKKSFFL
jgi:hypothetical protein